MTVRPRKGGLQVGRVPSRSVQARSTAAPVDHPEQDAEEEDPVFVGEEQEDPRSVDETLSQQPRQTRKQKAPAAARPADITTHALHSRSTDSSALTTAPSTRVSRTPRQAGTSKNATAHSETSRVSAAPASTRPGRSQPGAATPRRTSRRSQSRTPKRPKNTQPSAVAPSRSSRKPVATTSNGAEPPRTTTRTPKGKSQLHLAKKLVVSARKPAGTSRTTAWMPSQAVRRTPRRGKAEPSLPPSSPAAGTPEVHDAVDGTTRDIDHLPGAHLTLNDDGEIVPESPVRFTRQEKGKGRAGSVPQRKSTKADPTPEPDSPVPIQPSKRGLPPAALAAIARAPGQRKAARNIIHTSEPEEEDELVNDSDDEDGSYAGPGSQTSLSPTKYVPHESWMIGAQEHSPFGLVPLTDRYSHYAPSSYSKRKRMEATDDDGEVDRSTTKRRLEQSGDISQGVDMRLHKKDARASRQSVTVETRRTAESQPPATDLLKARTQFQRKLPNPVALREAASAMQEKLQPYQSTLQQGNGQGTKVPQQRKPLPHRDSEGDDEAGATSDEEPHEGVKSQAITRRKRQKRKDNIPPHHMGFYSPNSQAVLRAGKVFISQLILTHDAYPHDSKRREMGRLAWNYALEVEADRFAEASIETINDSIYRMFDDMNWKVRSNVKKAACIAVNNCYGLRTSQVAHDDTARDQVASTVARLLDRNRFLWFIPLPEYEDPEDPLEEDDVRRKASFYHPAIPWTITLAIYRHTNEESKLIYTPMPLQLLALTAAALHCALSEWKTGYQNVVPFTEIAYRNLYREYYWELDTFSKRKPGRCRNLCTDTTLACEEFIRGEPEPQSAIQPQRTKDRNELFHYAEEGEQESDDPDNYEQ